MWRRHLYRLEAVGLGALAIGGGAAVGFGVAVVLDGLGKNSSQSAIAGPPRLTTIAEVPDRVRWGSDGRPAGSETDRRAPATRDAATAARKRRARIERNRRLRPGKLRPRAGARGGSRRPGRVP